MNDHSDNISRSSVDSLESISKLENAVETIEEAIHRKHQPRKKIFDQYRTTKLDDYRRSIIDRALKNVPETNDDNSNKYWQTSTPMPKTINNKNNTNNGSSLLLISPISKVNEPTIDDNITNLKKENNLSQSNNRTKLQKNQTHHSISHNSNKTIEKSVINQQNTNNITQRSNRKNSTKTQNIEEAPPIQQSLHDDDDDDDDDQQTNGNEEMANIDGLLDEIDDLILCTGDSSLINNIASVTIKKTWRNSKSFMLPPRTSDSLERNPSLIKNLHRKASVKVHPKKSFAKKKSIKPINTLPLDISINNNNNNNNSGNVDKRLVAIFDSFENMSDDDDSNHLDLDSVKSFMSSVLSSDVHVSVQGDFDLDNIDNVQKKSKKYERKRNVDKIQQNQINDIQDDINIDHDNNDNDQRITRSSIRNKSKLKDKTEIFVDNNKSNNDNNNLTIAPPSTTQHNKQNNQSNVASITRKEPKNVTKKNSINPTLEICDNEVIIEQNDDINNDRRSLNKSVCRQNLLEKFDESVKNNKKNTTKTKKSSRKNGKITNKKTTPPPIPGPSCSNQYITQDTTQELRRSTRERQPTKFSGIVLYTKSKRLLKNCNQQLNATTSSVDTTKKKSRTKKRKNNENTEINKNKTKKPRKKLVAIQENVENEFVEPLPPPPPVPQQRRTTTTTTTTVDTIDQDEGYLTENLSSFQAQQQYNSNYKSLIQKKHSSLNIVEKSFKEIKQPNDCGFFKIPPKAKNVKLSSNDHRLDLTIIHGNGEISLMGITEEFIKFDNFIIEKKQTVYVTNRNTKDHIVIFYNKFAE